MTLENKNIKELQRTLAELEQQRVQALELLQVIKTQGKYNLAQKIKDMIADGGYNVDEIVTLLTTPQRRSSSRHQDISPPAHISQESGAHQKAYYFDPANPANTYVKGFLPDWMKQSMIEKGLDPLSKEDRNHFKAMYLQRFVP